MLHVLPCLVAPDLHDLGTVRMNTKAGIRGLSVWGLSALEYPAEIVLYRKRTINGIGI